MLWLYAPGRVVIGFLTAKDCSLIETYRCLKSVCREDGTYINPVNAGSFVFKTNERDGSDRPRNSRPATGATTETNEKADALTWVHHDFTSELCTKGTGKLVATENMRECGYRKVCAKRVLKMPTIKHKITRKNTYTECLQHT
jgi:hypothetical protein